MGIILQIVSCRKRERKHNAVVEYSKAPSAFAPGTILAVILPNCESIYDTMRSVFLVLACSIRGRKNSVEKIHSTLPVVSR